MDKIEDYIDRFKKMQEETVNPSEPKKIKIENGVIDVSSEREKEKKREKEMMTRFFHGTGIIDNIKNASSFIPTQLNNRSKKTLSEFGDKKIIGVTIIKNPLSKMFEKSLNIASFGHWDKAKEKYGFKVLYHLGLLLSLQGGQQVVFEKNEMPDIYSFKGFKPNTTTFNVPLAGKDLSLGEFVNNTLNHMGKEAFHSYEGLENNCQMFVLKAIQGNNISNPMAVKFTHQDFSNFKKDMESGSYKYLPKLMNAVTTGASMFSRLWGKGKKASNKAKNEFKKMFEKYVLEFNLTREQLNFITPEFIDELINHNFQPL